MIVTYRRRNSDIEQLTCLNFSLSSSTVTLNGRLLTKTVNSTLLLPLATPLSAEIPLDAFSAASTATLLASLATSFVLSVETFDWLASLLVGVAAYDLFGFLKVGEPSSSFLSPSSY